MARIVLNTFGSFGDLHPYLAVAIGLRERGHRPVIASSEVYRAKVEAERIGFAPVRPNIGELLNQPDGLAGIWHPRKGSEYLIRQYILPQIEGSYADLLEACQGADLLLTHVAGYAGPIVAEKAGLPWLSVVLQPMMFFSMKDPPIIPGAEWVRPLLKVWPPAADRFMLMAERKLRVWAEPITNLRRKVGVAEPAKNPLLGEFSPHGTLALFSSCFAAPQTDWPARTTVCGFAFYDNQGQVSDFEKLSFAGAIEARLKEFLDAGPPPLIFTLGSSAVMLPGEFYRVSAEAASRLGMRALLLAGRMEPNALPEPLRPTIHIAAYAPYSAVLPKGAATIHQGGVGTTAQAMQAGKPMLVVPWSHDQPDNAARIVRLGVGRTLKRKRYTVRNVSNEVEALLGDASYSEQAALLQAKLSQEDGITSACEAIERFLRTCAAG